MISGRMLPHTITITTPVEVPADYNNTALSYEVSDGATTRTAAAYVRPLGGGQGDAAAEETFDRDAVETAWRVHTNDLNVDALERITHDGVVYDIDGQPLAWRTKPGGAPGHTKLQMRRVDG